MKSSTVFDTIFRDHQFGGRSLSTKSAAEVVLSKIKSTPLAASFTTRGPHSATESSIQFFDILGSIESTQWLSGSVLAFTLTHALRHRSDVFVLDPQAASRTFIPPDVSIKTIKFLAHPVLVQPCHWGLTLYEFDWESARVTVYTYDPLNRPDNRATIQSLSETFSQRLVDESYARDYEGQSLGDVLHKTIDEPMQDDGYNCGPLCIVVAMMKIENFRVDDQLMSRVLSAHDGHTFVSAIHGVDLQALRMHIIHLIFSTPRPTSSGHSTKIELIHNRIQMQVPLIFAPTKPIGKVRIVSLMLPIVLPSCC
jgi:hypothetical protein